MILCSFLWRLRITRLESHKSKQMMVYEQITFLIKNQHFSKKIDLRIDFLIEKSIFRLKNLEKPGKNLEKPRKHLETPGGLFCSLGVAGLS